MMALLTAVVPFGRDKMTDSDYDELGCDDVARQDPPQAPLDHPPTPNTLFLLIASSKLKCSFTL